MDGLGCGSDQTERGRPLIALRAFVMASGVIVQLMQWHPPHLEWPVVRTPFKGS